MPMLLDNGFDRSDQVSCPCSQCGVLEFILASMESNLELCKLLLLNLCEHLEQSLHFFGMQFHDL